MNISSARKLEDVKIIHTHTLQKSYDIRDTILHHNENNAMDKIMSTLTKVEKNGEHTSAIYCVSISSAFAAFNTLVHCHLAGIN